MTSISVRKLPKDTGPAAWNEILPKPPPANVLDENVNADWLVIGAGFAGLSAACRLVQLRSGDRITVLDAVRVGEGPAGRNSGFMIDLPHDLSSEDYAGSLDADRQQIAMNRTAIGFARDLAEHYGLPAEAMDPCGKINGAATEKGSKHNQEYAAHLTRLSEPYEMYDAEEMKRITGTRFYLDGLWTPGTVMLQPAMYVRGLAEGLSRTPGVQIHEQSPVVELARHDGIWRAKTPNGSVSAPRVILAVNGHVENFGFFRRRLMHVFTYASMTRTLTVDEVGGLGGEKRWGLTPADPMGSTIRRISGTSGERLVIRNRFTYDPSMEVSEARIAAVARDHDRAFRARFPMLADVKMDYRWGGRLCLSRNNVPAFGEVEEGLFSACCQNGLGTAKGTLSGMLAADLAAQSNAPLIADLLAMPEPEKLPPEPIAWVGANAFIRWKERQAGREL